MPKKGESTLAKRTCRQCGTEFMGGPRAWYCPNCRAERTREADRRHKQKIRALGHADRPLGSIDKCAICGEDYVVQAARQKYCKKCAPSAVRATDREQSRGWLKRAIEKHGEEYYKKYLEKKRIWERENSTKENSCPMCGEKIRGRLYCSDDCRDAGKRYMYAKHNFKVGRAKTEPKFADYQKGGRLYDRKKNS